MKIAVIDVGFNSLKMVKYAVESDGTAKSYGQLGVMAKLGEGLESTGYLGSEQISRTLNAIRLCKESASLDSIDHLILIGTSPVREAANREEFLRLVHEQTGLKMRVLTGNEEALYGILGALRSVEAPSTLFFDLGGGSLELTYVEKSKVKRILSLPLGALKLTGLYADKDGGYSRKDRGRLSKHIAALVPTKRDLGLDRNTKLIGTGGTVRAVARYDQDERDYPFDKVHNYIVDYESVQRMSRRLFKLMPQELDEIDAIGEERSETIAAGTMVIRILMKKLGFGKMVVSTHGLRDGVLTEFIEGSVRTTDGIASMDEVEQMLARPILPEGLTDEGLLLECMLKHGLLDNRQKKILLAATTRGLSPEVVDADGDAAFAILMGEDLPMSHEDQLLLALSVVRARRPRTANWLMKKYKDFLQNEDKQIKKLGACVRLLEVLERSKAQFRVAYSGGLRISVVASDVPFPLGLARNATLGLSATIKKPVTIFVSAKERERHVGLVKVRG